MTPHQIPRLATVVIAPLRSIAGLEAPSWLVAFFGGCGSLLHADAIWGGLLIVTLLGVADYMVGYTRAKICGELDPRVAQLGLLAKVAAVLMVMGVRLMEWWLQEMIDVWPHTDGLIAAIVCAALIVRELHSLNEKGVRLPIVTQVLLGVESMLTRLLPGQPAKRGEP